MVTEEKLRPKVPSFCDQDFRKLMNACWDDNPNKRPEWPEIQERLQKIYVDTITMHMKEQEDLSHLLRHEAQRRLTMDLKRKEAKKAEASLTSKNAPGVEMGSPQGEADSPAYYSRRIAKLDKYVGSGVHEFKSRGSLPTHHEDTEE